MNLLTHLKKIRMLPVLIATALVTIATFASRPALATPQCGFTVRRGGSTNRTKVVCLFALHAEHFDRSFSCIAMEENHKPKTKEQQ